MSRYIDRMFAIRELSLSMTGRGEEWGVGWKGFFLTEIFSWPSDFFQDFNAPAKNYGNFSYSS